MRVLQSKRMAMAVALGALVLTSGGASAAGVGEGTPNGLPQESCLGQISANGVLLFGQTPAERAALFGMENAGEQQQDQLACQGAVG